MCFLIFNKFFDSLKFFPRDRIKGAGIWRSSGSHRDAEIDNPLHRALGATTNPPEEANEEDDLQFYCVIHAKLFNCKLWLFLFVIYFGGLGGARGDPGSSRRNKMLSFCEVQ